MLKEIRCIRGPKGRKGVIIVLPFRPSLNRELRKLPFQGRKSPFSVAMDLSQSSSQLAISSVPATGMLKSASSCTPMSRMTFVMRLAKSGSFVDHDQGRFRPSPSPSSIPWTNAFMNSRAMTCRVFKLFGLSLCPGSWPSTV